MSLLNEFLKQKNKSNVTLSSYDLAILLGKPVNFNRIKNETLDKMLFRHTSLDGYEIAKMSRKKKIKTIKFRQEDDLYFLYKNYSTLYYAYRNSVVYVLEIEDVIKIGTTENFHTRLYQWNNIFRNKNIKVLGLVRGHNDLERTILRLFDKYRIGKKEFFTNNKEIREFVKLYFTVPKKIEDFSNVKRWKGGVKKKFINTPLYSNTKL